MKKKIISLSLLSFLLLSCSNIKSSNDNECKFNIGKINGNDVQIIASEKEDEDLINKKT